MKIFFSLLSIIWIVNSAYSQEDFNKAELLMKVKELGIERSLKYLDESPADCPPSLMGPANFNLTAYVSKAWFVQEQMEIEYLPLYENFCVRAQYAIKNVITDISNINASFAESVLKFLRYSKNETQVHVFNSANKYSSAGPKTTASLEAVILNQQTPWKLLVGQQFIPRIFWGPYWVVAAGPSSEKYEWAIISGGPPRFKGNDGYCRTGTGQVNSGLWLFTRNATVPGEYIRTLRLVAKGLGFDISILNNVEQDNCIY